MPSYKDWGLGKSGKEGKSLGNAGALELGPGHVKAVLIWSQRPQVGGGGVDGGGGGVEKRAEDKTVV